VVGVAFKAIALLYVAAVTLRFCVLAKELIKVPELSIIFDFFLA
jgi:hypothetical protein